jgi:hypothetical protein
MTYENILTVVTPAETKDLTTLAIVKDELGITDTASDTTLSRWITESSMRISGWTEREWGLETVTELFRFDRHQLHQGYGYGWENHGNPRALILSRWPITEIASIVEDDIYDLVQGQDYEVDPKTGLVYRLFQGGVPDAEIRWRWRRKVFATYTGGYNLPDDVPLLLQQACLELIKGRWSSRTRDPNMRSFVIPGVIEKSFFAPVAGQGDMPPEVISILESIVDRQF